MESYWDMLFSLRDQLDLKEADLKGYLQADEVKIQSVNHS
jgi:hypothetical protein